MINIMSTNIKQRADDASQADKLLVQIYLDTDSCVILFTPPPSLHVYWRHFFSQEY